MLGEPPVDGSENDTNGIYLQSREGEMCVCESFTLYRDIRPSRLEVAAPIIPLNTSTYKYIHAVIMQSPRPMLATARRMFGSFSPGLSKQSEIKEDVKDIRWSIDRYCRQIGR
jgi:hypothetical protein